MVQEESRLFCERARLDDDAAVRKLLGKVPDADTALRCLRSGNKGRLDMYLEQDRTCHYLVSDRQVVMILTVTDVSAGEAKAIVSECDKVREWTPGVFASAVQRATGLTVHRAQ